MLLDRHMTKAGLLAGLVLSVWAFGAEARELRNPVEIGSADVRLLGFKLYEARLFTPAGQGFDPSQPHALELRYARRFDQESLLSATRKEMQRIEGDVEAIDPAIESLRSCFRDVTKGDRIKATALAPDRLTVSFNGSPTCDVKGPSLAQRFLSIWLSDKARDPSLSRKLRGVGQ